MRLYPISLNDNSDSIRLLERYTVGSKKVEHVEINAVEHRGVKLFEYIIESVNPSDESVRDIRLYWMDAPFDVETLPNGQPNAAYHINLSYSLRLASFRDVCIEQGRNEIRFCYDQYHFPDDVNRDC